MPHRHAGPEIARSPDAALDGVADGASILVPGFGPGTPWNLLRALHRRGTRNLTIIANSVGYRSPRPDVKTIGDLVSDGRVSRLVVSFSASTRPSIPGPAEQAIREGSVRCELVPQGTLAERIRAGGAGIPAFYTPAAAGTALAEGRETRTFSGREHLLETALVADVTLLRARRADSAGNLVYRRAARNFNPLMATAAALVIAEIEEPVEERGAIDPDHVHTPGLYVDRLAPIPPAPEGLFAVDWLALRPPSAAERARGVDA
ncbi:MAG: 3-oxoacid CoA-transferase subunit A [Chloroflexi bacterium]|nr:3-oxoacid CoA-transferase subunit A [Chloroflexota bacterium]